jgi:hypothetical protein
MQKDVLVIVRKVMQHLAGDLCGQQAEESLLLLVWKAGKQIGSRRWASVPEQRSYLWPSFPGQEIKDFLVLQRGHLTPLR